MAYEQPHAWTKRSNTFSWCSWPAFHWAIKHDCTNTERRLFFTSFSPLISWWSCLLCGTWKTVLFYSPCQCLVFFFFFFFRCIMICLGKSTNQSRPWPWIEDIPVLFLMHHQFTFKGTLISFCLRSENIQRSNNQGGFSWIPVCMIILHVSFYFLRLFAVPYAWIMLKKYLLKWAKLRLICLS